MASETTETVELSEIKMEICSDQDQESSLNIIKVEASDKVCILCDRSTVDELSLGPLYIRDGVVCHYFCVLFCSNLCQRGEDCEGILGFQTTDIQQEVARVLKNKKFYKCHFCKKKGATIGCCVGSCPMQYHFPCGLENHVNFRFTSKFKCYCQKHTSKPVGCQNKFEGRNCVVCACPLLEEEKHRIVFGSCCHLSFFHKECIQKYALSSGYMFKCPTCANKEEFITDMREQGIFVPERDASWELEPRAFEDLRNVQLSCGAVKCLCPSGKDRTDRERGSMWYLLKCAYCAASAMHIGCRPSPSIVEKWVCDLCLSVDMEFKKRRSQVPLNDESHDHDSSDSSSTGTRRSAGSSSSSSETLFSVIVRPPRDAITAKYPSSPAKSSCSSSSSSSLFSVVKQPRCQKPNNAESDSGRTKTEVETNSSATKNEPPLIFISSCDDKREDCMSTCSSNESLFIPIRRRCKKRKIANSDPGSSVRSSVAKNTKARRTSTKASYSRDSSNNQSSSPSYKGAAKCQSTKTTKSKRFSSRTAENVSVVCLD